MEKKGDYTDIIRMLHQAALQAEEENSRMRRRAIAFSYLRLSIVLIGMIATGIVGLLLYEAFRALR